jgi:hypothetical protein
MEGLCSAMTAAVGPPIQASQRSYKERKQKSDVQKTGRRTRKKKRVGKPVVIKKEQAQRMSTIKSIYL